MVARFKDDLYDPPNWAQDGAIPKQMHPFNGFDPYVPDWPPKTQHPKPSYPWWVNPFQTGPGLQPSEPIPGYPWWVDPYGFPTLAPRMPGPPDFPLPPAPQGRRSSVDPSQDVPTNWLQSYYDQNFAQQAGQQPGNGFDPTVEDDTSRQDVPERRLGRRTYRA